MIAMLFSRRVGGIVAALAVAGALWGHGFAKGHRAASDSYKAALAKAETETTEAINDAPVFTPDDPDVLISLCRFANLTDCPLQRNEAEPDTARNGTD